jgi:eukaryotic-like serine/threonine-protein kinase
VSKKKPTHIGRYKILGELGRGAMGVVYRAEDPALDRVVALKTIILSDETDGRKEYQKRFAQEARAAGKLTHPNIVTTFDFGEEGDLAYMAMELLEGTDLRERLLKGALPTAEAVGIAVQVADGLGFAHERGVVHRDIKPGNIMLLERGGAKIMDFGIARMRTEDFKTSTGFVMGTPRFMSPEQIAGEPVDQRSDLFSLGVVLYEMLTGKMLFAGEGSPQIAHNLANIEHEPPSRHNPEVTSLLDFIVARALKKDPAVRYQDAYELAADLRTCLAELGGSAQAAKGSDTIRTVKLAPKDKDKKKDNNRNDKDDHKNSSSPAAVAIAATTRLQLARQFDSSAALKRLAAPGKRDLKLLARVPRPVGFLRRICSDAAPRMLFTAMLIAAAASSYIVFG